jgi:hypothetical protein
MKPSLEHGPVDRSVAWLLRVSMRRRDTHPPCRVVACSSCSCAALKTRMFSWFMLPRLLPDCVDDAHRRRSSLCQGWEGGRKRVSVGSGEEGCDDKLKHPLTAFPPTDIYQPSPSASICSSSSTITNVPTPKQRRPPPRPPPLTCSRRAWPGRGACARTHCARWGWRPTAAAGAPPPRARWWPLCVNMYTLIELLLML